MAQMPVARAAAHFDSVHAVAMVMMFDDSVGCDRRGKAGPARAAVEFCVGLEQQCAAAAAVKFTLALLDIQRAAKGPFGPCLAQDMILHG